MKKCRHCGNRFEPVKPLQIVCDWNCGRAYVQSEAGKKEAAKRERKALKERKEAIKSRADWKREAQQAVNAFRRTEELLKGRGCVSCGRSQQEVQPSDGWKPGGAWDAGHFLGVGANESLRFEPRNIWLQCKSCNAGSSKYARKGATVGRQFRENLILMEGLELVEWLEGPHEMKKYTIEQLKEIRDLYRLKLKELKQKSPEPSLAGAGVT